MTRAPPLATEETSSPALVRALKSSEAALAACEARLVEAQAVVERQARDIAALRLLAEHAPAAPQSAAPDPAAAPTPGAGPAELADARAEVQALKAELAAVKGSTSWRVTSPLRSVTGLVRR